MPLDPDTETLLAMIRAAGRPAMETLSPEEARQAFTAGRKVTAPEAQEVAEVRDLACPGPHGEIRLRAYRPRGTAADEVLPALIYFHGGGWLLGDLESHDTACRHYANGARPTRAVPSPRHRGSVTGWPSSRRGREAGLPEEPTWRSIRMPKLCCR